MNHVKSLAGQTAVYGISSILGRVLNYLLVPLHTSIFLPDVLGVRDYLYVVSALLLIIYTHGMETTYFRFSNKESFNESNAFNQTLTSVIVVSCITTLLIWTNSQEIATISDYPEYGHIIRWLSVILFIDAITAIPFARLRLQNKARRFASLKILSILLNILFQVLFLFGLPWILSDNSSISGIWLFFREPLIDHIFLANLLANLIIILFFWKSLYLFRPSFSWSVFRPYFFYSLPLLMTGIAGWVVEQADKFLVKEMMTTEDLGIYAQTFKLAIFMQLAVQAFRYAGEPFFFNKSKDSDAPDVFADVLYYFTLFSLLIFVGVSVNVDLIGYIFLRNEAYRVALYLVPFLLMAKLFFGIYINISIWFKLKDKTIFGTYFTIIGAIITLGGNALLIPSLGYKGAAITMLLVYIVMTILCYFYGQKFFPVPYNIKRIAFHLLFASIFTYASLQIELPETTPNYAVHAVLSLLYFIIIILFERKRWLIKST